MINKNHALPVARQCKILDLARSSLYYQSVPCDEHELNMMSLLDEIHLRYPFYGSRRIWGRLKIMDTKTSTLLRALALYLIGLWGYKTGIADGTHDHQVPKTVRTGIWLSFSYGKNGLDP